MTKNVLGGKEEEGEENLDFSTLLVEIGHFGPQIRILFKKSRIQPDSEVWRPGVCLRHDENKFSVHPGQRFHNHHFRAFLST